MTFHSRCIYPAQESATKHRLESKHDFRPEGQPHLREDAGNGRKAGQPRRFVSHFHWNTRRVMTPRIGQLTCVLNFNCGIASIVIQWMVPNALPE